MRRGFRDDTRKPFATMGMCRKSWFVVLVCFLLWFLVICIYQYSEYMVDKGVMNTFFNHNMFEDNVVVRGGGLDFVQHLPNQKLNLGKNSSTEYIDKSRAVGNEQSGDLIKRTKEVFDVQEHKNESLGHIFDPREEIDQEAHAAGFNGENEIKFVGNGVYTIPVKKEDIHSDSNTDFEPDSNSDLCLGKYIYVHQIHSKFNKDLLQHCDKLSNWTNMCELASNSGLGPHLPNSERIYSNSGWFATDQFLLEVIFHNRMKLYNCLTNDSSQASAIFVPYYAGLDVSRYLWGGSSAKKRDSGSLDLMKWLREQPEWKKMWGRDHFMVAGRITWDFRRWNDEDSNWGNKLMNLPESKNMTILTIESSPWNSNDFAIPYPTYFHPSMDTEVFQWQNRMRKQRRRTLFSFAGGPRPDFYGSIRNEIIHQCKAARKKCALLQCTNGPDKCHKPAYLMKMFQNSVFCLQPPGDSLTRRSIFDSIIAGCIPVFFHPGSAYVQYVWHLPKDYTKYSVLIPTFDIKKKNVSIARILQRISTRQVVKMREEVVRLIPRLVYSDPNSKLDTHEDAFDISVKGVLDRVDTIRRDMTAGKNASFDYADRVSWKYNLFGTVEEHEWDRYFENGFGNTKG